MYILSNVIISLVKHAQFLGKTCDWEFCVLFSLPLTWQPVMWKAWKNQGLDKVLESCGKFVMSEWITHCGKIMYFIYFSSVSHGLISINCQYNERENYFMNKNWVESEIIVKNKINSEINLKTARKLAIATCSTKLGIERVQASTR